MIETRQARACNLSFLPGIALLFFLAATGGTPGQARIQWKHLSTANGDIPAPNSGKEQTSTAVFDINKDGINDFVITERTAAPAAVWYPGPTFKTKWLVHSGPLHIEAGSCAYDIDADGDLDFVAGGDWQSNEVWWWENPYPDLGPQTPWTRHFIKKSGKPKHHDQIFGDFDADGKDELIFWNQEDQVLFMARIPANPRAAESWPIAPVYRYSSDSQPEQRAKAPVFKAVNEHEGLAKSDIDGDGKLDLVTGGLWFKHLEGDHFLPNIIDAGYTFSRCAAGQLKKGGRPEVLLAVGDGEGPVIWYEWEKGTWMPHRLIDVDNGHSLDLVDFNRDGNLDIFIAEMKLNCGNPDSKIYILLGDGAGQFTTTTVASGYDNHESKIADLDGNGTLDIVGKPYDCGSPGLDVWLNLGGKPSVDIRKSGG